MSRARNTAYIKKLGNKLRAIREERGLTMQEVAARSQMELNSIYRIEKGRVDLSICTLVAIANALEIPPFKILQFKDA